MLYVFQVDSGNMMVFDMNLALEIVSSLKEAIWIQYKIPVDRQVLLVSGGESLNPTERVCNYHAGTDTNPIFLFNKLHIESTSPPPGQGNTNQIHVNYGSNDNLTDIDGIKDQVEGCLTLPPTYMTVVSRCQLAQQLHDVGKEMSRKCEQLTHDQHLQHQGWAAVVGNLEDIIISFKKRIDLFQLTYAAHNSAKEQQLTLLDGFEEDLKILDDIEVVPSLIGGQALTLYGWIESKDTTNPLRQFAHTCRKALESLDPKIIEAVEREANAVIEKGSQHSMKEIKGLEERLFGLDQLLIEAKKLVQEQFDLLQAFIQNQSRASDLKDSSILPDLCQSHQHQLLVMQKNHQQLDDIRRRCQKAKEELSVNLNARLKWVMYIQKSLLDTSNKLTMYNERLKRIKFQIEVMWQIHNTPRVYCQAVTEVVRRKRYTSTFLQWAGELASKMNKIYNEEIQRRREFGSIFDRHFLRHLFHGLDDFPKPFANIRPQLFDTHLPDLSIEDAEKLKNKFQWMECLNDFTLDLPTFTRSDDSTRRSLEIENIQSKVEPDNNDGDLTEATKDTDMAKLLSEKEIEVQNLKMEVKMKEDIIQMEQNVVINKEKELDTLKEMIQSLEQRIKSVQSDAEQQLASASEGHAELLLDLKAKHRQEILELTNRFSQEKKEEAKTLKDKCKTEVDSLKARFKFMSSIEQKNSVDSIERTMDPHDRLPKCEELLIELGRVVDSLQRIAPEGLSPYSVRKILRKLEGSPLASSPAANRIRNISETGQRSSVEMDDEHTPLHVRSVYGLDTSAVDATTMLNSDSAFKDLTEVLMPSQRIVNAASKLVQKDLVTIQSCKPGDTVFIYWNDKLNSYVLYLNIKNVHFLHTDCLKLINTVPRRKFKTKMTPAVMVEARPWVEAKIKRSRISIKQFGRIFPDFLYLPTLNFPKASDQQLLDTGAEGMLGIVQEKEYCVARRAQNRYRVPQGFHFYRVKVTSVEILNLSL